MKILHTADIHLGKKPFGNRNFSNTRYLDYFIAFEKLIDRAIEEEVELFIVAGDLFDKKELTPDVLLRTEKSFVKLKENGIKAYIIEGNHDSNNEISNSWIKYLESKELILRGYYEVYDSEYKFNKIEMKGINIYGIGYPGFAIDEVLENLAETLDPNEKNIVVVHTALGGGEYLPGLAKSESINKLKDKAIYVAGGHMHSYLAYPKENPFFFIPGSPEYWNVLKEKSDIKGCILFDTDTLKSKFLEIECRKRIKLDFIPKTDEIEEEFREFVRELKLTGEELVIVKIKSNKYINVNEFENILEVAGALKGYIEVKNHSIKIDDEEMENYSVTEIEKNIIESWEIFKEPEKIVKYLQTLKMYSEEKERGEDFMLLFDQMLEDEI